MIYITGDIHADPMRLSKRQQRSSGLAIQPGDYVIICGDFGIPWIGLEDKTDRYLLKWLSQLPFTVLFVDGNHENFDLLDRYPVKEWHGGRVHELLPNLFHLMRGEVFQVEGKTFFTFGGARSTDKALRTPHVSWWPQEELSAADFDNAVENLTAHDFSVDYVITHTAPKRFLLEMQDMEQWVEGCKTSEFLSGIEPLLTYKKWYFGHFHTDYVRKESVAAWMYQKIIPLER